LDRTNRTADKVRALSEYFASAPPEDAAWALYFLIGRKIKRAIKTGLLREFVAAETHLPGWLVDESYEAVGDLAETLALLLEPNSRPCSEPLHRLVSDRVLRLKGLPPDQQRRLVISTWHELSTPQRLVWHKLITGEFRVGVQRTLVARALAVVAGVAAPIIEHRLMGHWDPTAEDFRRLLTGESHVSDPGRPYPFYLAYPLDMPLEQLGDIALWQAEWKWDGIRAELLRRHGQVLVWSRGEELVTDRFPEVVEVGAALPDGTVLDGEVLAWRDDLPLPFAVLQRRIGRTRLDAGTLSEAPCVFMAYDLLELAGEDVRHRPLQWRRGELERLIAPLIDHAPVRLSPVVLAADWNHLAQLHNESRNRHVEGLMLKRLAAGYGVGRQRGDWWKWKSEPYSIDAVLIYAQRGHGRRASLYTDYTFGVWDGGALVPIAKAYSGLSDAEIREVDAFVRAHTVERFGPVRVVEAKLVFELHFEGIQVSARHKAGIAVRFPRMANWRRDKPAEEADTLDTVRALLAAHAPAGSVAGFVQHE
jgi:DNA ligase-1